MNKEQELGFDQENTVKFKGRTQNPIEKENPKKHDKQSLNSEFCCIVWREWDYDES